MNLHALLEVVQWLFLGYFVLLNFTYLGLNFVALFGLRRYMVGASAAEHVYSHLQMPVSLIVPAYNEATTIASSIRALLQLHYQHFEVIVVNDGSKDDTLAVIEREFQLQLFPEAPQPARHRQGERRRQGGCHQRRHQCGALPDLLCR
jgi:cellulose synthase/poly-beta-1,6-N-acetylglucosamine synthase-like glycosyltransferase